MTLLRKNNPLITGTIILTVTGFVSRFIGFFTEFFYHAYSVQKAWEFISLSPLSSHFPFHSL